MIKRFITSVFLTFVFAAHAYAAEDAGHGAGHGDGHGAAHGGHHGGGHHEAPDGLPQLDPSSFTSQIFWLVLIFVALYVFFARKSLPDISRTIENRSERIRNDLDSAERLKEEVATVQAQYEESLKKAREDSTNLFIKIESEVKEKTEAFNQEFQERSKQKVAEFEKNINEARKVAMEDMNQVAAEIAMEAAEKIIGVRTDEKSAKAVVNSLNKAA